MTELIVHGQKLEKLASEIREECDALKGQLSDAIQRAMKIGGLLAQARPLVDRLEWRQWLTDNTDLTVHTARSYIVAYNKFGTFKHIGNIQSSTFWYVVKRGKDKCDQLKALASQRKVTNDDLPELIGKSIRQCRSGMVIAAKALADAVTNDAQSALELFAGRDPKALAEGLERLAKLLRGQPIGVAALPPHIQADLAEFRTEFQQGHTQGRTLSDVYGHLVSWCKEQGVPAVTQKDFEDFLNERTTQTDDERAAAGPAQANSRG